MKTTIALTLVVALFFTFQSSASIVKSNNGLTNPVTHIQFDEAGLRSGRLAGDNYSSYGATFSSTLYQMNLRDSLIPNLDGGVLMNRWYDRDFDPFSISFNEIQISAAFSMASLLPRNAILTTYRGSQILESAQFNSDSIEANNFYHFYNESGFDKISVTINESQGSNLERYFDLIEIDNLQMGAVPEPSTYALMSLSVFLLFYLAKARNKEEALKV